MLEFFQIVLILAVINIIVLVDNRAVRVCENNKLK